MTFLFIATIGPVQPFIASARRTRDLYVGSTLLSELSKAAANAIFQEVKKEQGVSQLIFPAISLPDEHLLNPESPLNVANKIVAIIQNPPHGTGEKIREAIKARLATVKTDAMSTITLSNQEKADAQIANLVEYFWIAVPLEDVSEYKKARKRAEALLSARKNTQFFNAVSWGGSEAKSSIDGQRESVIPLGYYPDRRYITRAQMKGNTKRLYNIYNAGPHERLSAVDLLKRLGLKSMHEIVHSTSHIAASPFLEHLENLGASERQEAKRLWDDYIDKVGTLAPTSIVEYVAEKLKCPHPVTGNVDGALLFKERLLDETEYPDELKFVDETLAKFFRFTDSHLDGLRPSPYYVILLADGDGMGQAIDQQAERGPQGHQEISQALAGFANNVRNIVDIRHRGSLVYAGGDDVLALLPLHTALACARELHEAFGSALRKFQGKNGKTPTLSVGLVVVHHLSLLLDALELARKAEHKAKGHPEKDALAVIVKKRGGEPNEIVVPWNDEEERLSLLVALYNADIIPDGMAYELRTMLERLSVSFKQNKPETEKEKVEQKKLQGIIQLEAARILRRKLYFSHERIEQPDYQDIEQLLTKHLEPVEITETIKVPKTPHDLARYLLLRQIHVKEHPKDGFEILEPADITAFVDALIVAQTFAEALKPTATKGFVE